ncbi:hypothetical protein PT015_19365 [Candidatus Mycobacterium wuenschmannii]|uniref:Uncharacterized protein n=1 Tax=Candidatus Mycobacterium wuenschmannii TaxID=3027808 RepID=A0ABY8VVG9_9MYCO|nr:hypothetical protein [Candidatus Mycobacterium wuenschmannii]WIM87010.1 hypothetical protein PT015_19365 [Candidatus Mycobacterium wuenschmannii]
MSGKKAVAEVDAMVAAIAPELSKPAIERVDAILVTGPWLAGVTGVVAALNDTLPKLKFVESVDLEAGAAPSVVVFVVSAAAALTESDCLLLDAATGETDAVIGVVSKIDVHQNWKEVLAGNREVLAAHAPRYADVQWVGTAAAPEEGKARIDDLAEAVSEHMANSDLPKRNRLRAWKSRLETIADRYDRDADGAGRRARVETLREQRSEILRQRRLEKSERTIALRSQTQQAKVQLSYFARNRCASVRSELQEDAAGLSRGQLAEFEPRATGRLTDVIAEVDEGITTHLAEMSKTLELTVDQPPAAALPTVDLPSPQLKSRTLETRLMMLVGAGFGLGVALTLSRLLADLTPGLTIAGAVACAAIGLALTVWVVGMRGLLRDRALLDRWTGEATALVQSAAEQQVATRVLAAESSLTAALSEQDEGESTRVAEQVSVIDTELREHSVVGARAAALRGQEMPTLQAALAAVRAELGEPEPPEIEDETPSDDASAESEAPVGDAEDDEDVEKSSPTNTADNVF